MTRRALLSRGSLALVTLAAALASLVAVRPAADVTRPLHHVALAVPHVASGLGHRGHQAVAGVHLHAPGTAAGAVTVAGVAAVALLLFAGASSWSRPLLRRRLSTAAIRAPPAGQASMS